VATLIKKANLKMQNNDEVLTPVEHSEHIGFYIIPGISDVIINLNGVVISLYSNNIINHHNDKKGYPFITVWRGGDYKNNIYYKIHRLLALTFIGRPFRHIDKPFNVLEVNHIDGNVGNYTLSNLEWVTHKENMQHAVLNGLTNNTIAVLAKNIINGETKRYQSTGLCSLGFDIPQSTLSLHLLSKRAGTLTKNWHVFKVDNDSPWPEIPKHLCVESSFLLTPYWVAVNIDTNETTNGPSLIEVCNKLGFNRAAVSQHRYRCGNHTPYNGWVFSENYRLLNENIKEYDNYTHGKRNTLNVCVTDTITGKTETFNSLALAIKYMNASEWKLKELLRGEKSINYNNFIVEKI